MPRENEPAADLSSAVAACRADTMAMDLLRAIYARLDTESPEPNPPCRACGECCRFATAGHRLLASAAELALLTETPPPRRAAEPLRCPYQQGDLCTARGRRPLGCRVFFCNADAAETSERYEAYHRQISRLHAERGLCYAYVELTAAVAELLSSAQDALVGQNGEFVVDRPGRQT